MSDIISKIKYLCSEETIEGIVVKTLTSVETKQAVYKKVGYGPWIKV
jgi:hypothetical protein